MAIDLKTQVPSNELRDWLEPLIEAARPPHRTAHSDLPIIIAAIIWRQQNGAK